MGLPIGQHLDMQLTTAGGESVIKPYTPVSDDSRQGYVDFVIKVRLFCYIPLVLVSGRGPQACTCSSVGWYQHPNVAALLLQAC